MMAAETWKYIHAERSARTTPPWPSVIMAMSGRRQACRDLTGDGVAALANR
jgi:hypothetical protein